MSKVKPKSKVPNGNGRKGKPISLYPLTPEEALKRAMQVKPKKATAAKRGEQ